MARNNKQFTTIRTEGALLPPDILQRIASQKVDGMRPGDYHLPEGFKTTEAITQSWDMLKKHWKSFQEAKETLDESDTGTSLTNERWLLPLFRELDYGRLTTETSPVIEDRTYPIERFYNNTPIHLIGWNLPLDRRTKGARGAATASPHSMVQEYLNRSEAHLWAFVSNGRQLRLLRDNVALSRQAYVEFDLEAMMEGEVYSDFALLWMLCHQSRVEAEKVENCWLEKWSKLAREEGTRVLNNLREGVANAIKALGRGFLAHPQNEDLRRKLQDSGSLTKDDFYRQLLRIVYRLLFLFVAEDRNLLHPPDADEKSRELYRKYYSTSRLREMALKLRGSKHGDLWHSLSLVFSALGKNEGCPQLGLIGLGSFLWNTKSVVDVAGPHEVSGDMLPVQNANDDLLAAVRALAYVEQDRVLRSVDYRNLGSEELGSVYESLLELHPDVEVDARHFELRSAAGNERKTSGSYYTPDSLVQCLLDSALDPVVEDRLKGNKGEDAEAAILDIKVCDPACGSGHFLIAAAHRLARRLARTRTGESEPTPEDHQHALRDVIGHCIYGVDVNPMAVELCKVSLWIEAIEPGKPLSFLENRVRCGNSLLGTTPQLLADGIPDAAFKFIEGDDKKVVAELKKRNKAERGDRRQGQKLLFGSQKSDGTLASGFTKLSKLDDSTIVAVGAKEQRHKALLLSDEYRHAKMIADAWCSSFMWKKDDNARGKLCPTDLDLVDLIENPTGASSSLIDNVKSLSDQYQFFHWHIAFPEVFSLPEEEVQPQNPDTGWDGGFDVVVGNPPWEKINLKDEEYFASSHPNIAKATTKSKRKALINKLAEEDPVAYGSYVATQEQHDRTSLFFRFSGAYPLTGVSRVNLYSVFAEVALRVTSLNGRAGLVIASGIATDDNNKLLFEKTVSEERLVCVWDFENREPLFPDVHRMYKFCIFVVAGARAHVVHSRFAFFLSNPSQLSESGRQFTLNILDLQALNPTTKTCPTFRNASEAVITKAIYHRMPAWSAHTPSDCWPGVPKTPFNMANDSELFVASQEGCDVVPLYESKLIHQFNHRYATEERATDNVIESSDGQLKNPLFQVTPRFYIERCELESRFPGNWFFVYRMITNASNERTTISTIVPKVACGHSLSIVERLNASCASLLAACTNSFVFDYCARQKVAGSNFSHWIWKQLPLPELDLSVPCGIGRSSETLAAWMQPRTLELMFTSWEMGSFASECGYDGPPFRWDEERRLLLRHELDAVCFHVYLGPASEWGNDSPELREMFPTSRDAIEYIMETFPIVKRKDIARTEIKNAEGEVTQDGSYISKDTILSIYDEMQQAIDSGQPYQTRLAPPPGPPTDAHGNFIPMAKWDPNNWPSHVHPPREEASR